MTAALDVRGVVSPAPRGRASIDALALWPPGPGEVLVRVSACGVCGTDRAQLAGTLGLPTPVVLGHEGAGVIEAIGPPAETDGGADELRVGDHVVLTVILHCGACARCRAGEPYYCRVGLGATAAGTLVNGSSHLRAASGEPVHHFFAQSALATHVVVDRRTAVRVPSDVPLELACLLACGVATGAGTVLNLAAPRDAESLLILGCGGVGLAAVMAARIAGIPTVVAVDVDPAKTALALELGATDAITAGPDLLADVKRCCREGVACAIEAVGDVELVRSAVRTVRPGGSVLVVGAAPHGSTYTIDASALRGGRRIEGVVGGSVNPHTDIPYLLELFAAGRFPLDRLLSDEVPFADAPQVLSQPSAGIRTVVRVG